jgi:hypothetical protein
MKNVFSGSIFLTCALDKMDTLVKQYFKSNLGLGTGVPDSSVETALVKKFGVCGCTGPRSMPLHDNACRRIFNLEFELNYISAHSKL